VAKKSVREQFEEWFRQSQGCAPGYRFIRDPELQGQYDDPEEQIAWEAYRAGRRSLQGSEK